MNSHQWNNWQKSAFACRAAGSVLIVWPAYRLYAMWSGDGDISGTDGYIVSMLAGVVLLATGGTLHKVGMSREQR